MLAYNLMSLFRQVLLKTAVFKGGVSTPVQHTLQTLRYKLFAKPTYTTTEGRKPILNLALAMQHRQWMQGLWDEAKAFDLPVKFAIRRFFCARQNTGYWTVSNKTSNKKKACYRLDSRLSMSHKGKFGGF